VAITDSLYLSQPFEETDLLFTAYVISVDDEEEFTLPSGYFLPCYFLTPAMEEDDA